MYERRGRTEATVVLLAWSWPAFRRAWPRTGRAKALVFDSALACQNQRTPHAACGVLARRGLLGRGLRTALRQDRQKNALAPVRHTSKALHPPAGALRLNLSSQAPLCTRVVYFLPSLAASPGQTPAPRRSPAAAAPRGARPKKKEPPGRRPGRATERRRGRRAPTAPNKTPEHHVRVARRPPLPDAQAPRSRFLWGDFCWIRRQHGIASRHEVREARPAVSPVKARV